MKTGIKCRAWVSVIVIASISLIALTAQLNQAAAPPLPTFSYRPGRGLSITAADESWAIRFLYEFNMDMTWLSGNMEPLIQLGQGIVWSVPATQVGPAAAPQSDPTTETQTNPDGSTTTYRTERGQDGSSTTTVTRTNRDGSTQVTGTYRSNADGSWTSTETNPDGSRTTIMTEKNPDGSWTTSKTTTPPQTASLAPAATTSPLSSWHIALGYRIRPFYYYWDPSFYKGLSNTEQRQETLLRLGRGIVWSTPEQYLEGVIKQDARTAGVPGLSAEPAQVRELRTREIRTLERVLLLFDSWTHPWHDTLGMSFRERFGKDVQKADAKTAGTPRPSEEPAQKVEEKTPGFFESLIPALIPSIGIGVGRDRERERRHPNPCAGR
ncbi:MAG: hypothetical protein HY694_00525 [Deltaproteobacteria bacterium]|nr:hypothetical protein [Deltaproteobacteria bacterium]